MKTYDFYTTLKNGKYSTSLKLIRKGNFYILLDEEAFYFAWLFSFKLQAFGKSALKAWFPAYVLEKWKETLQKNDIRYAVFEKEGDVSYYFDGIKYISVNMEDYMLKRERILSLKNIGLFETEQKDFLLKQKTEQLYHIMILHTMKLPKKERFYIREKIERHLLGMLEHIYTLMYQKSERKALAELLFSETMILREFLRLLHEFGKNMGECVYMDLSNRIVEILKILKRLKGKYEWENISEG